MKTCLITGASRGFGLLIARLALARGDNVVATARQPQSVMQALGDHPRLLALPLDVTDEHGAAQAVTQATARFGRIDVLVNNAGYGLFAVEGITEALAQELQPLGIHATVVEPGFFRTDFLDASSLSSTATVIEDYAATVGAMRSHAAEANHQQPGDPYKLAVAILLLADADRPPVRLPLGSDTVARLREKNGMVERELDQWMAVALSTDHDTALPTP